MSIKDDEVNKVASKASKVNWIQNIVKERTFADVGGLWGTTNEMITVAIKAGCREATMIDIQPLGNSLWKKFDAHCQSLGVSDYRCLEADATAQSFADRVGFYDVVHCSGVIYHVHEPISLLLNLRKVTKEYLILTSMIVPNVIKNSEGVLSLEGGCCYFIPLLNGDQKKVATKYFEQLQLRIAHINGDPVDRWIVNGRPRFGPWWWLLTKEYLRGVIELCEMRIIDEGYSWAGRSYSFLCQVK